MTRATVEVELDGTEEEDRRGKRVRCTAFNQELGEGKTAEKTISVICELDNYFGEFLCRKMFPVSLDFLLIFL